MKTFKLLRGNHAEGGQFYNAQDNNIVESEKDLVKAFGPEKFKEVIVKEPVKVEISDEVLARAGLKDVNPDTLDDVDDSEETDDVEEEVEETESDDEEVEEEEDAEEDEEVEEVDPEFLTPVHKGGGRYVVIDARDDEPIHEGTLSKAEAHALANGELEMTD